MHAISERLTPTDAQQPVLQLQTADISTAVTTLKYANPSREGSGMTKHNISPTAQVLRDLRVGFVNDW